MVAEHMSIFKPDIDGTIYGYRPGTTTHTHMQPGADNIEKGSLTYILFLTNRPILILVLSSKTMSSYFIHHQSVV